MHLWGVSGEINIWIRELSKDHSHQLRQPTKDQKRTKRQRKGELLSVRVGASALGICLCPQAFRQGQDLHHHLLLLRLLDLGQDFNHQLPWLSASRLNYSTHFSGSPACVHICITDSIIYLERDDVCCSVFLESAHTFILSTRQNGQTFKRTDLRRGQIGLPVDLTSVSCLVSHLLISAYTNIGLKRRTLVFLVLQAPNHWILNQLGLQVVNSRSLS